MKASGSSITEGIGQGRITANLEGAPVDIAYQIPDEEALPIVFDLAQNEGLLLGGSSGINVAGAIRLARDLGPGHTIVTVLCDLGARYASKLFNPEFLREAEPADAAVAGARRENRSGLCVSLRPALLADLIECLQSLAGFCRLPQVRNELLAFLEEKFVQLRPADEPG